MSLIFDVRNGLGVFVPKNSDEALKQQQRLRDIVAEEVEDEKALKKMIKAVKAMVDKDPLFLRGYAVMGELLGNLGDDEADMEASEVYVKGCRAALKIMPEDFQAPLDLENSEVQCFLRCHAGYVEALVAKGDYPAALEASYRQLAFDPEDQFERRRELAELCIMAGKLKEAEPILTAQLEERSTAWYSLAYLAFLAGDYKAAVTRLRRGFVLAPYAVDYLTGRLTAPNLFWEQGPRAPEPHDDLMYVEMLGGDMWSENQEAHEFMEWLSQTSLAMRERAAMVEISEKSFGRETGEADAEKAFQALWDGLDDTSSAGLLNEICDPESGERLLPWRLLALDRARSRDYDGEEPGEDCGCGCGAND